jgi:putative peptide zinc metalloprotease protein
MQPETPASDLERRKKVRVQLRPDLDIAPHRYEGRTFYIVKDPVGLRYYRFKEEEHFLLRMMDGKHTLDDAQKQFEERFRPERLPLEDLEGFAQQLLTSGLAHNESPQAGQQLFDRRKKRLRREWMATFTNILYIKIPIIDPDKLLSRLLNGGLFPSFLRTPIAVFFFGWLGLTVLGTVLAVCLLVGESLGVLPADAASLSSVFSLKNAGLMAIGLLILYCVRRLSQDLKFIFTSGFLLCSVLLWASALSLVLTHWHTFWERLPDYHSFFQFKQVVYLWIALGAVKIIHEFGHGLSCKAFGGEVHEMGALFLCLSPCLYCNVSDAWTMPSKWQRIIISFAGIYVELVIAALATFLWWNSASHPFVNNLSLSLMVVCSVSTVVFNGNPLMRYDGYYILADWLEIPNLRDRCNKYLQRLFMEHCLGIETQREAYMALWRRILFVVYAVISYVYRWVVTFSILYFLYQFLKPYKLGAISAMMAMAAGVSMVGWPLYRLGQGIHKRGRLPDMKSQRVWISTAVVVAVLVALFIVPLPVSRVRDTGLVQLRPEALEKVFVPNPGGVLEELFVRNGDYVENNQILARFRNVEQENQLEEAKSQRDSSAVQVESLTRQIARTTDVVERGKLVRERTKAQGEHDLASQRLRTGEAILRQLREVRAPRAGVVLGLPTVDEVGKYWEKEREAEAPLCSIGEPEQLRVLVPVSPADYRLLDEDLKHVPDLPVTVRVQGRGLHTWKGRVSQLPQAEARDVPPALTNKYGGPLAVRPAPGNPNSSVLQAQYYLVGIDVLDPDRALCPGTLANAKIHCRWRTGAWWLWRWVSLTFDLGLF